MRTPLDSVYGDDHPVLADEGADVRGLEIPVQRSDRQLCVRAKVVAVLLLDGIQRPANAHRRDRRPAIAPGIRPALEAVEDPGVAAVHDEHPGRPAGLAHGCRRDPKGGRRGASAHCAVLAGAEMSQCRDPPGDIRPAAGTPGTLIARLGVVDHPLLRRGGPITPVPHQGDHHLDGRRDAPLEVLLGDERGLPVQVVAAGPPGGHRDRCGPGLGLDDGGLRAVARAMEPLRAGQPAAVGRSTGGVRGHVVAKGPRDGGRVGVVPSAGRRLVFGGERVRRRPGRQVERDRGTGDRRAEVNRRLGQPACHRREARGSVNGRDRHARTDGQCHGQDQQRSAARQSVSADRRNEARRWGGHDPILPHDDGRGYPTVGSRRSANGLLAVSRTWLAPPMNEASLGGTGD